MASAQDILDLQLRLRNQSQLVDRCLKALYLAKAVDVPIEALAVHEQSLALAVDGLASVRLALHEGCIGFDPGRLPQPVAAGMDLIEFNLGT